MKKKKDKGEGNEEKKKGMRREGGQGRGRTGTRTVGDEDGRDEDLGRSQYREPEQSRSLTQSDSCEDTGK